MTQQQPTTSRADAVDGLVAAARKEWKRGRGTREYAAFLMAEAQVAATLTVAAEIRELNRKLEATTP